MEDYERFRLSRSNIIMIFITLVLLIGLIVAVVLLIISLNKPKQGLPKLNVTSGRITTRETTMSTATTPTTTTKKVIDSSPYYELDIDNLFNDPIYSKSDISREEAEQIGKDMFNFLDSLYDITNYKIFDLDAIKNNVKSGEEDLITIDGVEYGELYNYEKLIDKLFSTQYKKSALSFKYDNKRLFIKENGKYYRALNFIGEPLIKVVDVSVSQRTSYQIIMDIKYYNTNYKELGYSSPNYNQTSMILRFDERWKFSSFMYPLYK